ncbi:unnamed protein product [Amoebophrya sp. A120]|nr:unnamed protein product [Amoebophrya sp. A120]|eukprot:GSA120T00019065001.1
MGAGVGKTKKGQTGVVTQYDNFNDYLRNRDTVADAVSNEKDKKRHSGASTGSGSKSNTTAAGTAGNHARGSRPHASSSEEEPMSSSSETRQENYKRKYQMAAMPSQEGWHEKKHRSKERGAPLVGSDGEKHYRAKNKRDREEQAGEGTTTQGGHLNTFRGKPVDEDMVARLFFEWQHGHDWKQYEGKYQEILKHAFVKHYPTIKFYIGKNDYEVNFRQMTQKNLKTGNVKKIRMLSAGLDDDTAAAGAAHLQGRMPESKFQWLEGGDKWKDFDWAADKLLWQDYKRGMATTRLTIMGHNYDIDYLEWTQTNIRTKKVRKIRLKNIVDQGMTPDANFAAGEQKRNFTAAGTAEEKEPQPTEQQEDYAQFLFQFYEDSNGKWLNYPKSEQKQLAEAWASKKDVVELGPEMKIDFKEMKENGRIPVRRVNLMKTKTHYPYRGQGNRVPEDNPNNKRDCFEWYDPETDQWHVYAAQEDKKLKYAWLNKQPTVRFEMNFEPYEVNFEMLKQKNLQTSEVRSIRNPIKFGAFRRRSKTQGYDNADFFEDLHRERAEEQQKERDAQFRKTPKEWDGIWGRRFTTGGAGNNDKNTKQQWKNAFFGAGGGARKAGVDPPDGNNATAGGAGAGGKQENQENKKRKASGQPGPHGNDPFFRANFGTTPDPGSDSGSDTGRNNRNDARPKKPTPLPTGPKLDASVNVATRELHQQMERALNEPLAERKAKIKKWQLQYHPDKNPEKMDKCTQVFQFLMQHKEWFLLGASPNNSPQTKPTPGKKK